ncbi:DUF397 domain-containing protein [Streptomyces sp. NPDC085937]|uniref:DUF397 domain-containing protein n=1 Tax=Streptomyces sp. NPDC085937 TaxID=3365742 RepID=UPI0037D739E9
MSTAAPTGRALVWHTSSYSNGAGGECVAFAATPARAHVRDTKEVDGPVVTVTGRSWTVFVQALRAG